MKKFLKKIRNKKVYLHKFVNNRNKKGEKEKVLKDNFPGWRKDSRKDLRQ